MSIPDVKNCGTTQNDMISFIIVIRSFNDIDHIAPFVYYLLTEKKNECRFVLYYTRHNLNEIYSNPNIKFLRETFSLDVYSFSDERRKKLVNHIERAKDQVVLAIQSLHHKWPGGQSITTRILTALNGLHQRLVLLLTYKDIRQRVTSFKPDLICTDLVDPATYPYNYLFRLAKRTQIPLVAFPHGLPVFDEPLDQTTATRQYSKRLRAFDRILAPNEIQKGHVARLGYPPSQIIVLGSLRYENRWLTVLAEQVNVEPLKRGGERHPKIVLFLNRLSYRGSADAIKSLVSSCSEIGSTIVKPHTRPMDVSFLRDIGECEDTMVVDNSITSTTLIEWCDIALFWGTSMGIQVIARGKSFVYPSFAHGYKTIYESYFPDRVADNIDEVTRLLTEWRPENTGAPPAESVQRFLQDVVYAGSPVNGAAERYYDLLRSLAQKQTDPPLL